MESGGCIAQMTQALLYVQDHVTILYQAHTVRILAHDCSLFHVRVPSGFPPTLAGTT